MRVYPTSRQIYRPATARHDETSFGEDPKEKSDRIVDLLRYPEDSVGGVMINDMVFLEGETKVAVVREQMAALLEKTDFISLIFLVDDMQSRKIRGSVMLRELLAADDGEKLEDMMDPYVAALNPFDSAREAAYRTSVGS